MNTLDIPEQALRELYGLAYGPDDANGYLFATYENDRTVVHGGVANNPSSREYNENTAEEFLQEFNKERDYPVGLVPFHTRGQSTRDNRLGFSDKEKNTLEDFDESSVRAAVMASTDNVRAGDFGPGKDFTLMQIKYRKEPLTLDDYRQTEERLGELMDEARRRIPEEGSEATLGDFISGVFNNKGWEPPEDPIPSADSLPETWDPCVRRTEEKPPWL